MPTLTIDGQEITVERGTTILEAAKRLGIDIPTFCYHPGLSAPANCRMCLVDTNKAPKPLPACFGTCMDEMEVSTTSEHIEKTRRSVLEFILLNHPVDCPICDQAGECVLQDHYFRHSAQPSRLGHQKVHKPKAKRLGPSIMLDAERCILCTRCVRFCDEVAGVSQLEMVHRGEHAEISTFPGAELDNPYAGNTVDICPVGALTSTDFRFRTRVWMLQSARSVCGECSRGCSMRVDTFENVARRFKPAHNPRVNDWWMCDEGRYSHARWFEGRMEGPAAMDGGRRRVTTLPEAIDAAASALGAADRSKIAVLVSTWLTNEDAWLLGRLLAGSLAGAQVFVGCRPDGEADEILRRADKNPNRQGVETIFAALEVVARPLADFGGGALDAVLVAGDQLDLSEGQTAAVESARERIVMGAFLGPLWEAATTWLPARIPLEKQGTWTNHEGLVQRLDRAILPVGTCKSEGYYALRLSAALSADEVPSFRSPRAVFAGLSVDVEGFRGLDWEALRPQGQALGEGTLEPEVEEAGPATTPPPIPRPSGGEGPPASALPAAEG